MQVFLKNLPSLGALSHEKPGGDKNRQLRRGFTAPTSHLNSTIMGGQDCTHTVAAAILTLLTVWLCLHLRLGVFQFGGLNLLVATMCIFH